MKTESNCTSCSQVDLTPEARFSIGLDYEMLKFHIFLTRKKLGLYFRKQRRKIKQKLIKYGRWNLIHLQLHSLSVVGW